jgi:hypothetical protein
LVICLWLFLGIASTFLWMFLCRRHRGNDPQAASSVCYRPGPRRPLQGRRQSLVCMNGVDEPSWVSVGLWGWHMRCHRQIFGRETLSDLTAKSNAIEMKRGLQVLYAGQRRTLSPTQEADWGKWEKEDG